MSEAFELGKWLAQQTDRALFIMALLVGGWAFLRVLKRSETQTDLLLGELRSSRELHHARMSSLNDQVFENCQQVTSVVATNTAMAATNTAALDRTNKTLERLEGKR